MCLEHELDALEQSLGGERTVHHSVKGLIHAEEGTPGALLWGKIEEVEGVLESYSELTNWTIEDVLIEFR
jgi:hypothetical protein